MPATHDAPYVSQKVGELMPAGEIGTEASFQLILNLTTSIAALQRDIEHISADLRSLRIEIIEEKKERAAQSSEHGSDINRIEWTLAGLDKLSAEELQAVRRRMGDDERAVIRQTGLKWPIIVGLIAVMASAIVTVAVNLILRAVGG